MVDDDADDGLFSDADEADGGLEVVEVVLLLVLPRASFVFVLAFVRTILGSVGVLTAGFGWWSRDRILWARGM